MNLTQNGVAVAVKQAHGVKAEKQHRAAMRKLDKQSVVVVQGMRKDSELSVAPQTPQATASTLRGGEARVLIDAAAARVAIVNLFKATERGGLDMVEGRVGATRASKLFNLFKSTLSDALKTALNLKECGYAQGTFEYVTLSEANTFRRAWEQGLSDKLSAPKFMTVDGKESTSWRERLTLARAMLKQAGEQRKEKEIAADAYGRAAVANPEATPVELAETAKTIAAEVKQANADAKQVKRDERNAPEATAKRDAARFVKASAKDGMSPEQSIAWLEGYARAINKEAMVLRNALNARLQAPIAA